MSDRQELTMQEIAERAGKTAVREKIRGAVAVIAARSPYSLDVHVPLPSDRERAERTIRAGLAFLYPDASDEMIEAHRDALFRA